MLAIAKQGLNDAFGPMVAGAKLPPAVDEMVMIFARPGQEQEARDAMRRRGVGAWWPNYRREVTVRHRETGKRHASFVLTGMMPGIILSPARLDKTFWQVVDLAPGVVNVIRRSGDQRPILLNDVDVALIHAIEAGLNTPVEKSGKVRHAFKAGDRVVFADDVMSRWGHGKVVRCHRGGKIEVEANVLGFATPVHVWPHQIKAA